VRGDGARIVPEARRGARRRALNAPLGESSAARRRAAPGHRGLRACMPGCWPRPAASREGHASPTLPPHPPIAGACAAPGLVRRARPWLAVHAPQGGCQHNLAPCSQLYACLRAVSASKCWSRGATARDSMHVARCIRRAMHNLPCRLTSTSLQACTSIHALLRAEDAAALLPCCVAAWPPGYLAVHATDGKRCSTAQEFTNGMRLAAPMHVSCASRPAVMTEPRDSVTPALVRAGLPARPACQIAL